MASVTILSDNGATSGSAGLKTTGGNDGVLLLQTTTAGGTATTAMSISNTQVVTYTNQPTYTGGTANGVLYLNGSKAVTSGTALVFDGSNLGLGVTPSAWDGAFKVLDVAGGGAVFGYSSGALGTTSNAYYSSAGWKYKATGAAGQYQNALGAHYWYTAASGTAGTAISFTQAMTLDASGQLFVAATSATNAGNINVAANSSAASIKSLGRSSDNIGQIFLSSNNGATDYGGLRGASDEIRLSTFTSIPLTFYTNGSERARINSSGILVGSTSTQGSSVGGQFYDASGYPIYYASLANTQITVAGTPTRICANLGSTADPAYGYVLLCKAYQGGSPQSLSAFTGQVYRWRGSAGAFLEGYALQITVACAYTGNSYGAANFGQSGWNIVSCVYGGVTYLAVRQTSSTSAGGIQVNGVYTNDFTPILVSDGSVSSVTVLATY